MILIVQAHDSSRILLGTPGWRESKCPKPTSGLHCYQSNRRQAWFIHDVSGIAHFPLDVSNLQLEIIELFLDCGVFL